MVPQDYLAHCTTKYSTTSRKNEYTLPCHRVSPALFRSHHCIHCQRILVALLRALAASALCCCAALCMSDARVRFALCHSRNVARFFSRSRPLCATCLQPRGSVRSSVGSGHRPERPIARLVKRQPWRDNAAVRCALGQTQARCRPATSFGTRMYDVPGVFRRGSPDGTKNKKPIARVHAAPPRPHPPHHRHRGRLLPGRRLVGARVPPAV